MFSIRRRGPDPNYLNRYFIVLVLIWSVLLLLIMLWDIQRNREEIVENVYVYTKVGFDKDILYRRWATMHGGLYVPVSEYTQPNPYLVDTPERDITTPSGIRLTLMNPAYMSRQVYELETEISGVRSHISSLNPIRPENKPDAWEKKALEAFNEGELEVVAIDTIDGREYFRLMRPFVTEEGCLKCHAHQGYKLDDIRGGISVSYPMDAIYEISENHLYRHLGIHGLLWFVGMCSIIIGFGRLKKIDRKRSAAESALETAHDDLEIIVQERTAELSEAKNELQKSAARYRSLYENVPTMNFNVDEGGVVLSVNHFGAEQLGYQTEELTGKSVLKVFPDELHQEVKKQLKKCFDHPNQVDEWEIQKIKKDRTRIWVREVARVMECSETGVSLFIACQDITDRKQAEEEKTVSEEKLQSLIDNLPAGVVVHAPDTTILLGNEMALNILGIDYDQLTGKTALDPQWHFFNEEETQMPLEDYPVMKVIHSKQPLQNYIVGVNRPKFNDRIWALVNAFPLFDENSELQRVIVTFIEITARKEAEKELKQYREHLEDLVKQRTSELESEKEKALSADKLKSAFLATMSHELRTPLNSIIGFTGILLKELAGPLNPEQSKQLQMAKGSAHHLLDLINDVLDISKIEAGELVVSIRPFDFHGSIQKVIATLQPFADKKGLELVSDVSDDVGEISSDQRRVEQILMNLLTNAIKFTEKGSVKIACKTVDKSIVISLIDTGIGIDQKDQEIIFIPFSQVDTGLTRNYEGTGLGLSIVKKLVDKLGGAIDVESEPGVGSTFTVVLPLNPDTRKKEKL